MWLALRFIHWAMDYRGEAFDTPTLVVQNIAQRQQVVAASTQALAADVHLGMSLADAQMRLASAVVLQRHTSGETAAISRLAGWAWGYSSRIHCAVAGPDIECARIAMEIGASLRLFGGRKALLNHIRQDLNRFDYRYQAGVGDSPQAALAFARMRRRAPGNRPAAAANRGLASLPIDCLELSERTRASLAASGFRQTGELLALPPGALARRYGNELLDYLERLRARKPHGLALYRLPERYRTRHELIGAVESTQGLVFVLRRIFLELAAFLRGADSAIQTLRLTLIHDREPATHIVLKLSAPSHDAHHLERVAHERLDRLQLVAPVLEISLLSDPLRRSSHVQGGLWADVSHTRNDSWAAALDRLRARLGHDAVSWIAAPAEHRPEAATAAIDNAPEISVQMPLFTASRPLWLLPVPQPIEARSEESLQWISGPERIETGWWQAGGIRRDYYRALDENGRLLWVFRDIRTVHKDERQDEPRYYLHGLFA